MRYLSPVIAYFRSSKEELEKVSWPTKQEIIRYSTIVVVASVLAAAFFGALDAGLYTLVSKIVANREGVQTDAPISSSPVTIPTDSLQIEGVDANGNPADLKVVPQPVNPTPTPSN